MDKNNNLFYFLYKSSTQQCFWLVMIVDTSDSGTAVFGLTHSLEIWMGENLLTPFTEGTSLLNRALEV